MNKKIILPLLCTLAVGCLSTQEGSSIDTNKECFEEKKVYIVSLNGEDDATHKSFLKKMNALAEGRIRNSYHHALNGYSLSLTDSEAEIVKGFSEVEAIYHNNVYSQPESTTEEDELSSYDNYSAKTMNVDYSLATNKGSGITIGIVDTGLYHSQVATSSSESSSKAFVPLTGDALSKATYTEASLKAKIDAATGFNAADYVYQNSKIIFEYDYADGDNNTHPGSYDHGTHVASLAGANGKTFQGISPNSQMAIMKVFNSSGSASDEKIVLALDDAYVLGLDVVNMSLGNTLVSYEGIEESAVGIAIKKLKTQGTMVNIAMGNDNRKYYSEANLNYGGDKLTTDSVEPSLAGSYAVYKNPNLVASSVLDGTDLGYLKINGKYIPYTDQVYDIALSSVFETDAEIPFSLLSMADVDALSFKENQNKIAVIEDTAQTNLRDIVVKILSGGYSGVVILTDKEDRISYRIGHDEEGSRVVYPRMPVVSVSKSVKDQFVGNTLSVISKEGSQKLTMSVFSTEGPTSSLQMNPDITAPGTKILGASSVGYVKKSGTSMATPNFSGACALLLSEAKNTMTDTDYQSYKKSLMAAFQSTASAIYDEEEESGDDLNYASPRRAGAGMVDVQSALKTKVYLESKDKDGKAGLELYSDEASSSGKLNISFVSHSTKSTNTSYKAKLYIATPKAELGISAEEYSALSTAEKSSLPKNYEKTYLQSTADHLIGVYEYPSTVTIQPGENTVTLPTVDVNKEFNNALDTYASAYFADGTFLEGYLMLEPADASDEDLTMPYLTFYGDYSKASAVEPFDFERDETKTYNSDIINNLFHQISPSYSTVDISSCAYTTSATMPGSIATNDLVSLLRYGFYYDSVEMARVGTSETDEKGVITAGCKGVSDLIVIQQYVNRSCNYGYVSLLDSTGKSLKSNWISCSYTPYGTNDDGSSVLLKSYFTSSLYSSYYVPVALSYMSLQDSNGNIYPDGNYTLRFTYNLFAKDRAGTSFAQTKDVPVKINSSQKAYFTQVGTVNGKTVLYVSDDTYYAIIRNETVMAKKDETTGKNYIPVPENAVENGYLRMSIYAANYQSYSVMVDMKNGKYALLGNDLDDIYSFAIDYSTKDNVDSYRIYCYDSTGAETKSFLDSYDTHGVVLNVKKGFTDIRFYSTYTKRSRSIDKYENAYYIYDEASGQIMIMGMPGYFSTIQFVY